jgi:hypothetical protein
MRTRVLLALSTAGAVLALSLLLQPHTPSERLERLQKEVAPRGGVVFRTTLGGRPLDFLLLDCQVDLLDASHQPVLRQRVLEGDFYLGFTICQQSSIRDQDGYVKVNLRKPALGAGGGNVGGGTDRSRDGPTWERFLDGAWVPKT